MHSGLQNASFFLLLKYVQNILPDFMTSCLLDFSPSLRQSFEPQIKKAVIDKISRVVVIHHFLVEQYGKSGLHAAGTWQIVLFNELTALGTFHMSAPRYVFQQDKLIVGQKSGQRLVLHTKSADDMLNGIIYLLFIFHLVFHLIKAVEYLLDIRSDTVKTYLQIMEHRW